MKVYLDNAATTVIHPEVVEAMTNYWAMGNYNPSSSYTDGLNAHDMLDECRGRIADTINAEAEEIYFTSGGSEGDNWAIKGIADAYSDRGKHIITSAIEHKAVLNTCKYLEDHGYSVTYIEPDSRGVIQLNDIQNAIRNDTILVSIMFANNEIGTIEPIKYIAQMCRDKRIVFHTDAVQAYSHVPINVKELGIDLLTVSAHKFHGPNGVGFLYKREGVDITPLIHGGKQEMGIRGGTENVAGIIGMAKAAEISHTNMNQKVTHMISMRDTFIQEVLSIIPDSDLNGSLINRLCNNVNIYFKDCPAETAVAMLDACGISCSAGSACNSGEPNPSHVLKGIGCSTERASQSLRFTFSEFTTFDEINYTIEQLKRVVGDVRRVYA